MIVPTYNVAPYIDDFIDSIVAQDSSAFDLELIFVDDGSTDTTPKILAGWGERYPDLIRIIRQENQGLSAARNTGLTLARGKWVSFPDPDDFLHPSYLRHSRNALIAFHLKPLLAVCTNLIFYFEDIQETQDKHPLRTRFRRPVTHVNTSKMKDFIHLSAASIWLRKSTIDRLGIKFEGHNWGSFEDAHFINRIFIAEQNKTVTFIRDAKYFYRKRSDQSSRVDISKVKKSYYIDQLRDGTLSLAQISQKNLGIVPEFIQRTMLYEVFYHFKFLLKNSDLGEQVLSSREQSEMLSIATKNFDYIDAETIENFHLAGCHEEHKVALLAMFKTKRKTLQTVYVSRQFKHTKHMDFSWYCGADDDFSPIVLVNGENVECIPKLAKTVRIFKQTYFSKKQVSLELNANDHIEFFFNNVRAKIKSGSKTLGSKVAVKVLLRHTILKKT
jgi:glycosyltransferase involved in cell wall biosynthesis